MNFDALDLYVVPADSKTKRPFYQKPIAWSDASLWCSWQEREDIYPGATDWYVIPPSLATYKKDGVEIGYYVIDIDNHDGDNFRGALEFLRSCKIPPSLTVRTPSGGLHIYYWAIKDDIPKQLNKSNALGLPIEIKTSTGVIAPNGRDRCVIKDLPPAYLTVTDGSPLSELMALRSKKIVARRAPLDPDYELPEPQPLPESQRHDTMTRLARRFQDDGCPPDKMMEWLKKTRDLSPGTRPITDRELRDIVSWQGSGGVDDLRPKLDFMEQATPLTGWEKVFGQVLFSNKDEAMGYIMDEASTIPDADADLVAPLLAASTMDELKSAWVAIPSTTQLQYVWLKDCMKHALSLA